MLKKIRDYLYIFIFLCYSGNPFFTSTSWYNTSLVGLTIFLALVHVKELYKYKAIHLYVFICFFSVLFLIQSRVLGLITIQGSLGFLTKLLFGYIIINVINKNFKKYFFNVLFIVSVISLIGFSWNLLGKDIPAISLIGEKARSLIIFTQKVDGSRNSGMFWEPGAFACYLIIGLASFLGEVRELLKIHLKKTITVLIALITTYSTTGYIALFILILVTLLFEYSRKNYYLAIGFTIVAVIIGIQVYRTSDFLEDKIDSQLDYAIELEGEFSPGRFGAFLFDIHYIEKHPFVGNGMIDVTRYADHPALIGEHLGHGNGFSNFIASMGIPSMLFYIFYILYFRKKFKISYLIIFILLLQGEPLMNYPLFITIPFLILNNERYSNSNNMS